MRPRSLANLYERIRSRRAPRAMEPVSGPPTTGLAGLLGDERGALFLEYAAVTGFVAIVAIPALLLAGMAVASSFVFVRGYMLYPFP